VRTTAPEQLAALEGRFRDPRLPELLFRYRAQPSRQPRAGERQRWQDYRRQRLLETAAWANSTCPSTSSARCTGRRSAR
jgi:exonuclease I